MPDSTPRPLLPGPPRTLAERVATWVRSAFLGRLLVVGLLLMVLEALGEGVGEGVGTGDEEERS